MRTTRQILIVSDIQYPYHDKRVFAGLMKFGRDLKPDTLVLNGDGHDCYSLSRFTKDPDKAGTISGEVEGFQEDILSPLAGLVKRGRLWYTEGNHEKRFQKYLWNNAQAFSGLDGLSFEVVFGLKKLGFTWCPEAYPPTFGRLTVMHGHMVRRHSGATARGHFERHGCSMVIGHSHRQGAYFKTDRNGTHGVWEGGCLCRQDLEYESWPDWQQGWAVATVFPNGLFNVELVTVIDRSLCVYGGNVYGF